MNESEQNAMNDELIQRALIPPGLRPTTNDEIERMLDSIGGEAMSDGKLERMLRKVTGEEPIGVRQPRESSEPLRQLSPEQEEQVALYLRAEGKEIPPDIQEILDEIEKRAAEPPDEPGHEEHEGG